MHHCISIQYQLSGVHANNNGCLKKIHMVIIVRAQYQNSLEL